MACVDSQEYDRSRIEVEWVIADDGTDPIGDLVADRADVTYVRLAPQEGGAPMALGAKRQMMHAHCTGDVMLNMDDDDYYPPTRVAHAVERLEQGRAATGALIAGCSELHVVAPDGKLYQFGPYRDNHATAASFAYYRAFLERATYCAEDTVGEERAFLAAYTLPLTQLDPRQTILVFMHPHNTLNRQVLIDAGDRARVAPSPLAIRDFFGDITDQERVLAFYRDALPPALAAYRPGEPANKQHVHIIAKLKERIFALEAAQAQLGVENTILRRQVADKQDVITKLFDKLKSR